MAKVCRGIEFTYNLYNVNTDRISEDLEQSACLWASEMHSQFEILSKCSLKFSLNCEIFTKFEILTNSEILTEFWNND